MKPLVAFLLIISICLVSVIGLSILSTESNKTNGHIFKESGTCPNCGQKLIKGIYGYYFPRACWYCPDCP